MCHYANDKSSGDFILKMQLNEFGDPQISCLDLRGDGRDKGIGKDRREGDSCGRGTEEGAQPEGG